MPPKTERFELRLEQDTLDRLDNWRRTEDDVPTRSEAVRRLVEAGLAQATTPRRVDVTNAEKLILYMLCDIYEKTKAGGELDPRLIRKSLLYGHSWALEMQYSALFPTTADNRAILTEVVDMLDMWNFIEAAVERLNDEERKRLGDAIGSLHFAAFTGFDYNHEIDHASVMSFLVEDLERFSRFKTRAHLNSHSARVGRYRRMLSVFEPIRPRLAGRELSMSELIEVLEARTLGAPHD
jgi:uncharacterized protein